MTHAEFQKSPQLGNIRMALGATTSVPATPGGVARVIAKIADGLRAAGVPRRPDVAHERIAAIRDEIGEDPLLPPPPTALRSTSFEARDRPDRRRWLLGLGAVLLLLGVVFWGVQRRGSQTPFDRAASGTSTAPNGEMRQDVLAVGVMDMRAFGAPDWMCDSTRTNVNTVLSKFAGLRVFAEEKIDFLRKKRDLTAIEAAEELKIKKMISGTVSLKDGVVTLDAHVVDIATSLLEHSARVTGREAQLIELQNRIALKLVEEMHVQMDPTVVRTILAERTNEDLEEYKLLTETLGVAAAGDKQSRTPRRGSRFTFLSPAAAHAAETTDESAVRGLLEAYRAALEAKDIDTLSAIQLEMSEGQRNALTRYFLNADDLRIQFSNYDVLLEGEDAIATFTRSDVFRDAKTGREVRLEVRYSTELTKRADGWKIVALKKPS
jgi:TolB-like protein/ketosteroid isomerase-like protein